MLHELHACLMRSFTSWASSRSKRPSIIDADHPAISHVSTNLHVVLDIKEVRPDACRRAGPKASTLVPCGYDSCRNLCIELLGSVRSIYRACVVKRSTRVEASAAPREAPSANLSQQVARPFM